MTVHRETEYDECNRYHMKDFSYILQLHRQMTNLHDPSFQFEEIKMSKQVTSISQGKKEMRKQFLR